MMPGTLTGLLAFLLLSLAGVPAAGALGPGGPTARLTAVSEGTLWWRTASAAAPAPAPLLATDVEIRVTGIVARALVRQEFANPTAEWAEGVYVFPLPEEAAVDHMRMRIGDRLIEGVIEERAAAKTTYAQARQQGRRTSLVEQERPNVFTASVANIAPGAAIVVEIEYQHVVRVDEGVLRLRFPTVVGPRYVPGVPIASPERAQETGTGWAPDTDQVPDASRITPPVIHPSEGPINPVRLRVELLPGVPLARIEAPHHDVTTVALPDGRHVVTLADDAVPADRDFELVWQPAAGGLPAATVLGETVGGEAFALLLLTPPAPELPVGPRTPREAVFVVDTSGSMHGASIAQAVAALRLALARLQPGDTFNVIQFNSRTESLFPAVVPVTPAHQALADRYVSRLAAQGGTEMLPALTLALDGRDHPDRLRQVVFLTDGAIGNEDRLFAAIRERLGDSRLFTIGIGSAPNGHFMREAARLGRGTFTYIGAASEVRAKIDALFRKLESPVLTDVALELPDAVAPEMFPARIPDLYLGEPVIVTLRAGALPARGILRGRLGAQAWTQEIWIQDARPGAGLAVHWARAKISALLDARRAGTPADEVRTAVIDVALRHHLVTPYTSLVAVDVTPARPEADPLRSHALPTNLPHGWDHTAVFGLGQGATSGRLSLALGLVALLLAGVAAWLSAARAGRRPAGP